jgi:tRNA 2-selenouridine synthase
VLGGLAGAGKTESLALLAGRGEQVLDLEALARHRGSAFGHIGQPPQPSHLHFQELVATALDAADPERPLYVEDEARFIGSVGLPPALADAIGRAPLVLVETPFECRVERLVAGYGSCPRAQLLDAVERSARRLGGERTRAARHALLAGRVKGAVEVLLPYYDAAYRHRAAALSRPVWARVSAA